MSRPNSPWYPVIRGAITRYPANLRRCDEARRFGLAQPEHLTQWYLTGSNTLMPLPQILTPGERREFQAVQRAILQVRALPFGQAVLQIVDHVDWRADLNLWGAADRLYISHSLAQDLRQRFYWLVGRNLGYPVTGKERWKVWMKKAGVGE